MPNLKTFILSILTLYLIAFTRNLKTGSLKGSLLSNMNTFSTVSTNAQGDIEHHLTITGTASRIVTTNLIIIGLNVETLDIELSESYRRNTLASNRLSEVFSELGISDRNITTTSYETNKQFRSVYNTVNSTWGQIFEGYKVSNKLNVILTNLGTVSTFIDNALSIGNVLITNIAFEYSIPLQKKIKDAILPVAARDAANRAKISANALKVNIDDVKSVNVINDMPFISQNRAQNQARAEVGTITSDFAPQIFSGKSRVEVNVNVDFLISKD